MDEPPVLTPSHPAPDENWFTDDPALQDHLRARLPADLWSEAEKRLLDLGVVTPRDVDPLARLADRHRPILHRFAPTGERVDEIEFHPAYRELQRIAREHQTFTLAWEGKPRVLSFALGYVYAQAECGYFCPACMTDGAAFVLDRRGPRELADKFVPRLVQPRAEGAFEGAMFLTEKAGGSDVGATQTRAAPADDGTWRLTGHKWFCSNVGAEVTLTLARMPGGEAGTAGLGLFLLPWHLADGSRNPGVLVDRLKDKLGVTSMPTGEVTLDGAVAYLVAPEGEGMRAMLEMVNLSRLYNAVASVAIARRAVREGVRAGQARRAFGKPLLDHPLFARAVLDLAVESEGALAFVLEASVAFDRAAAGDADAKRRMRALTPLAKAATARLAVRAASEACEFLGGNGYVEDFVTPRLLRDAQVLPIWEGTTNVQALEFLRAAGSGAASAVVVDARSRLAASTAAPERARRRLAAGLDAADALVAELAAAAPAAQEAMAVRVLNALYHAYAGALLVEAAARGAPDSRAAVVADVFVSRFVHPRGDDGERALEESIPHARRVLAA